MLRSSREGPTEEKTGRRTPIRLGTALIAATGLLLGPLALATSASASSTPHATAPVQGSYVPVTPFRITDTRTGSGLPNAGTTLTTAAPSLNVQVTGVGTAPVPVTASAVVLNVTATGAQSSGFLTVFPEGITQPTVSNLNYVAGQTVANLVTTALSATGQVTIYSSGTDVNVVVDVEGYYTSTPSTNGSGLYNSMSPVRALGALAVGATVAANTSVPVTVTGTATGVPASATAVVVNVTAAHGTAASFLSVYPAPALTAEPAFSNVNFGAGQAVCNRATVAVGTGGQIEVYNHSGTVDVDVDVDGYYTGVGGTGSYFVPLATPVRVADTRTASLVGTGTPIGAAASESFSLATTASGIPAAATSVAANFTVVAGTTSGYLSVYPAPAMTTQPNFSDENWVAGGIVPNFTIADTEATGSVEVYNSYGTINLVVDVFGYFMPFTSGPIMVSAVVTDASISITYNQAASCPSVAANLALAFAYDWSGAASGGTPTGCTTSATNADVLVLTTGAGGFVLPGSTGGSITYTAGPSRTVAVLDSTVVSVYSTNATSLFSPTQTLVLGASGAPAIVSAYTDPGTHLVVTYNEDVSCAPGAVVAGDFAYNYTGVASGFEGVSPVVTAACSGDTVTLTDTAGVEAPLAGASVVYTSPTSSSTPALSTADAVYATGSVPALFAATQTETTFATPAITAAAVTPGVGLSSGSIAVTYSEPVVCPATVADVQALFVYSNGGSPAYPTTCVDTSADVLTLGTFVTTLTGSTAATLVLPLATDTLTYTEPATDSTTVSVNSTVDSPAYPATQTFVMTAVAVPAMVSAVVTVPSIAITYNEGVSCPATGADADFVYYYQGVDVGGAITGCTSAGDVLTLAGTFTPNATSATIVYTAPAAGTTANAVYATGGVTYFAATQTLALFGAAQAITFTSTNPSPVIVSATYRPTATAPGGTVVFSLDAASAGCTGPVGGAFTFTGAGDTCIIDANQAGVAGSYLAAPEVQQSIVVSLGTAQTITFGTTNPTPVIVGSPNYTPTATSTSGLPVAITVDGSSAGCTLTAGVVSFTGPAGTCIVDANQAGNATYAAAPQVQQLIVVGSAPQAIAFTSTATTPVTVGTTYTPTATSTSGLPVAITVDGSSAGCTLTAGVVKFTAISVTCILDANQTGNASYLVAPQVQQSIPVTATGSQTITFTSMNPTPVTTGSHYTATATATSTLTVAFTLDTLSAGCSLAGAVVTFTGAGTCIVDANQTGNASWNAAPQVQQLISVS